VRAAPRRHAARRLGRLSGRESVATDSRVLRPDWATNPPARAFRRKIFSVAKIRRSERETARRGARGRCIPLPRARHRRGARRGENPHSIGISSLRGIFRAREWRRRNFFVARFSDDRHAVALASGPADLHTKLSGVTIIFFPL
jgi:hypothetical protein